MWLKLLSFLVFLSAYQAAEYVSLIAPGVLYDHKPYTAYLATSQFSTNLDFAITLRKETAFDRIRRGQEIKLTKSVTFDRAGLNYPLHNGQVGFPLNFLARQNGKCINKEILIVNTPKQCHTFIQLDKPFYKPNDEVRYRIFVLDHDTKPISINSIQIEIKDSSGNIVERQMDLTNQTYKNEGLYENIFSLGDDINLGGWTIYAKINGNPRIFAEKKFNVEKVKLPYHELFVNCKDEIYLDDRTIDIQIYGKYAHGGYSKGNANLTIINTDTGILMYEKNFKLEAIKTEYIHIKNDLEIRVIPLGKLNLKINIKLDDESNGQVYNVAKNITLYCCRKHSFEIRKFYPYQSGFSYEFAVAVFNPNRKRIAGGNEPVKLKYIIKLNDGVQIKKGIHGNITKGLARFEIPAYGNVKEIEIFITYKYDEFEEIIRASNNPNPLRVTVKPKTVINENQDLQLTIEYKELYEVIVLAIGRSGIVDSTTHNCLGENICRFYLYDLKKHYDELKPEAKIVVYSKDHDDKQVLYGSALFKFEGFNDNDLNIKVPFKGEPKQPLNISYTSKINSIVSILAIDNKQTLLADNHDVTREDVINALTNTKKLAYAKNEDEDVFFDRNSNNFIINLPLDKWRDCSDSENKTMARLDAPQITYRLKFGGLSYENEEEAEFKQIEEPENNIDEPMELNVRENFAETWIWDTKKLTDGDSHQIEATIPDSMTNWLFTGFSIHKDYGLAIAKPQELKVSKEFFIELHLPYSIKFGEIYNLEVFAFNFVRFFTILDAEITVIADSGQFEFVKFSNYSISNETEVIPGTSQLKNIIVPHRSGSIANFLIKPLVEGKIEIRIEAEVKNLIYRKTTVDKIVKDLMVEKIIEE